MEWFQENEPRFLLEVRLLKRHYPGARVITHKGVLMVFNKFTARQGEYTIKVVYPRNFPGSAPAAYIVKPRIEHTPHSFSNGRLCLHSSAEVGPQTSGKVICDWSIEWIRAYESWLRNGGTHFPSMRRR